MKSIRTLTFTGPLSLFVSAMLFATTLLITSCSKDKASTAYIMVVNGSQSSPSQDFYIDGSKINTTALAYGKSTAYLKLVANTNHQAVFNNSVADTADATTTIAPTPGDHYSAYFGDNKTINIYPNDLTSPQSGNARVRFINLSSAVSTGVDFAGIVSGKDSVITSGAQFALASPYSQISTLSNTFTLALTGTSTVLLNMPVTLQAGKIYSLSVSGSSSTNLTYSLIAEN